MGLGVVAVMLAGAVTPALPGQPAVWLGLQSALAGACGSVALVAGSDLPARLTPPDRLGAVMGAQRAIALGVMPVSALAVGTLGTAVGTAPACFVWLGLAAASALPCLKLGESGEPVGAG